MKREKSTRERPAADRRPKTGLGRRSGVRSGLGHGGNHSREILQENGSPILQETGDTILKE